MTSLVTGFVRCPGESLQASLRRTIVAAIGEGRLTPGQALPPTRVLARQLGIARNTVASSYDDLVECGILEAAPRRGIFVAESPSISPVERVGAKSSRDWNRHLQIRPTQQRNIVKAADWEAYPYPFVYGQVDPSLFPLMDWRACSRDALGRSAVNWWSADHATADDPMLIEQIRRHILPRRGIHAKHDEILVTLGSQHGMYLLSQLLVREGTIVGIEDPGYPDVRNTVLLSKGSIRLLPVDDHGVVVGKALKGVDIAVVTPANQCPTMVTMPRERRASLLDWARENDALLVEDEYEGEIAGDPSQLPALSALDPDGRVVHLGTFSKVLAPGFRLGFMIGPAPLIAEARALRRLIHRSVPLNNQRTAALFIADGHYESLVRRLGAAMTERRKAMMKGLAKHLPDFQASPADSGTSVWLRCPDSITGPALIGAALERGVIVEPGGPFFADPEAGLSFVRLGFSSIKADQIEPGLAVLAEVAETLARNAAWQGERSRLHSTALHL